MFNFPLQWHFASTSLVIGYCRTGTFLLYGFCFCILFLLKTFRTTCTTEGFRHVGEFHIRKITVLGMHKAKMLHMCRDIVYRMSSRLIYNCVYTVIISNNLIKATQCHNNYHSWKSLRVSSSSFWWCQLPPLGTRLIL